MKRFLYCFMILSGMTVFFSGCYPAVSTSRARTISSGSIGCPPAEINVSNMSNETGGYAWTAECNGATYYCSATSDGANLLASIDGKCAPAQHSSADNSNDLPLENLSDADSNKTTHVEDRL